MQNSLTFSNRDEAGKALAEKLLTLELEPPVVVLGLPRGGVPVAGCVAEALGAALDIITVRKIGAPGHEELACGAVASGGIVVWNQGVLRSLGLAPADLASAVLREQSEIKNRERSIRTKETPVLPLKMSTAIIVDDGVATGATMRAAIRAVRAQAPKRLIVALPVGPADTCRELEEDEGAEVVCLQSIPTGQFGSVGQWYDDFSQVETELCREILVRGRRVGR